jgi:hypothetical protein
MWRLACLLVLCASTAHAAPAATLDLVVVNGIDPGTGYLTTLPTSLDAGREHASELAACAKHVTVDYKVPSSVLVDVYVTVGADGTVSSVELQTDPSTKIKRKTVSKAAKCLAPLVKTWTFPDHETLLLRFALTNVPVKKGAKVPAKYVKSLTAVCAAVTDNTAGMQDNLQKVMEALTANPSAEVKNLLGSMGNFVPATRSAVLAAHVANAGIASCPTFEVLK